MARTTTRRKRPRGSIEELPSGALRVSVYAGVDPLSKRRHYLREVVPASPTAEADAERALRRLVTQVDERRSPRTTATVDQLLDRHFELLELEPSTLATYRGLADKHIRPLIGQQKVGSLRADTFDSFHAELRRCRTHCDRRQQVEHRTEQPHQCDHRCRRHQCRPLSKATVRQIHVILSGALKRAVRWGWIATNPIDQAEPPPQPTPNAQPPTAEEAARILNEAWADADWGVLVWLTMVTGFRRGELCALRWRHVDLVNGVLVLERSIGQLNGRTWEKDTKTHQHRRIALDSETVALLAEHRERCLARAVALGVELADDAFVFSPAVDGSEHLKPDTVSQRYSRLARRLGIKTSIHKLRHYSATDLIAAGVDVRTVAGRLGHGGGGTTTLRVYAAWVAEADQRAAAGLLTRLPDRPPERPRLTQSQSRNPYVQVAADLQARIVEGTLRAGEPLPTVKELASTYNVAVGTAHRAVVLLREWGLVDVRRGSRPRVLAMTENEATSPTELPHPPAPDPEPAPATPAQLWEIVVRAPDGTRFPARHVHESIEQPDAFRTHLVAIARREA